MEWYWTLLVWLIFLGLPLGTLAYKFWRLGQRFGRIRDDLDQIGKK